MSELDTERVTTMSELDTERVTTLYGLDTERLTTLCGLDTEKRLRGLFALHTNGSRSVLCPISLWNF